MAGNENVHAFETFKLGGIEFSGFEVPELVPLGGEQAHSVKDFPGGDRQVQSFGYHRRPLTWTGILIGSDALKRHQALETMCDTGKAVTWSFGNQLADVLVTRYHPDLMDRFEIHYALEMVVVQDHAKPVPAQRPDADTQILAGLQKAMAAFDLKSSAWPPVGLSNLYSQWAVDMDWLFPWSELALASLNALVNACEKLEAELDRFIEPLATEATLVSDLEALLAAEEALSGVRVSRMAIGTYLLGRAAPGLWAAGTSVWELGSQLYGDVSRGVDILMGNKLTDPTIKGPTKLTVLPATVSGPTVSSGSNSRQVN